VPLELPENRVQRVLERTIQLIALRGAQFVEIAHDARARLLAPQAVAAVEVSRDLVAGEDRLGDLVDHRPNVRR
jgi:hypothetical protein